MTAVRVPEIVDSLSTKPEFLDLSLANVSV